MSVHVNLLQEHKAFLSLIGLPFPLSPDCIYKDVHVHMVLQERCYSAVYACVYICACKQQDPGGSQIAGAITHTNSESSTLLSPYSEIRFWNPLALQPDQSADLQPPLQHTDEA